MLDYFADLNTVLVDEGRGHAYQGNKCVDISKVFSSPFKKSYQLSQLATLDRCMHPYLRYEVQCSHSEIEITH